MKKTSLPRFLALVALVFSATVAYAFDFEVDGIYYEKNSDGVSVSVTDDPNTPYSGSVVVPSKVTYNGTTYAVTGIGDYAFSGCESSTSVTIPASVTTIGEQVFNFSSGIESIKVDSGNSVFDSRNNCNAIIETSTNALLYGCKNTNIPNNVTSIGYCAFCGCTGLTSVTIPNSVTSIGDSAFDFCDKLTVVTIPNSVTEIGESAFCWCKSLATVNIPNSVIKIGGRAFFGTPFEDNFPRGLVYLGRVLYKYHGGMWSKTSIEIKEGTISISGFALNSCTYLESVTMPNSLTYIGENAFQDCTGLTSVDFGNAVNTIIMKLSRAALP